MTIPNEVLVSATNYDDLRKVESWLESTCIPAVRPLYNVYMQHDDGKLKAATLSKLTVDGSDHYILTLLHDNYLKSFEAVGRNAPAEVVNQGYIVLQRKN